MAGRRHNKPDPWGPEGRYAYSIRIQNLPAEWAKTGERVEWNLLQMLRQHTEVQLEHPSTGDGYLSGVKEDGKQYAYAFISVTKEEDGPIFMRDMRMVVMDNVILQANWSTKSMPATPGEGSTVINAATGERQTWHPIRG